MPMSSLVGLFTLLKNKIIDYYRERAKTSSGESKGTKKQFINQTNSFFDFQQNWKIS